MPAAARCGPCVTVRDTVMLIRLACGVIVALAYFVMSQMLDSVIPGGMSGSRTSTQFTLEEPTYTGQNSSDDDSFGFSR